MMLLSVLDNPRQADSKRIDRQDFGTNTANIIAVVDLELTGKQAGRAGSKKT